MSLEQLGVRLFATKEYKNRRGILYYVCYCVDKMPSKLRFMGVELTAVDFNYEV